MIREESIRIPFHFAAGRAGSRTLTSLRDDQKLLGSYCPACARTVVPVRSFCPICAGENLEEVELGPGAELISCTKTVQGMFALVRSDGADNAMIYKLLGEPGDFAIGMRLSPVFADERRGHISDLEGFVPDQEERP
ncbi:MAG: hypothetical protein GY933_17365 [Hyphomicrobiales bacterium]|nr:hypothetical protein [Hyphomicrobiales bacterium]